MAAGRASRLAEAVLGIALVGGLVAGCVTTDGSAPPASRQHTAAPPSAPVVQPAAVRFYPPAGAHGVNPADVVTASVAHGTISRIALTSAAGKVVAGRLSPDHTTWTVAEPLGYGRTYTWSGSATGEDGKAVPIRGRFRTLSPERQISGRLNVSDGETYGVAIPIALTFSSPVTDKLAVEQALSVTTSKPTTGLWAWLDDQTVHWRPSTYYSPGTHVTVAANLYGVPFAPGVYGRDDISASFTIGRSQVVRANTKTHRMVVITDGRKRADYPASFGLDSDPGRVTNSGTHVVMARSRTVL